MIFSFDFYVGVSKEMMELISDNQNIQKGHSKRY